MAKLLGCGETRSTGGDGDGDGERDGVRFEVSFGSICITLTKSSKCIDFSLIADGDFRIDFVCSCLGGGVL